MHARTYPVSTQCSVRRYVRKDLEKKKKKTSVNATTTHFTFFLPVDGALFRILVYKHMVLCLRVYSVVYVEPRVRITKEASILLLAVCTRVYVYTNGVKRGVIFLPFKS